MESPNQEKDWFLYQTKGGKIPIPLYWEGNLGFLRRIIERTITNSLKGWKISETSLDSYSYYFTTISSMTRTNICQHSMVVESRRYLTEGIFGACLITMVGDLLKTRTRKAYH